jgi:hypothetical protein
MKSTTDPESKPSTRKSARSKSKEKTPSNVAASQRPPDPRVGTRSVNTLSDAQLERKRANDREAQRIIRQRTREHIENLERQVTELGEQKEQLNKALQHNSELEAQIAALQRQLADMALLLQYRQSPGVHGYTDTAPAYGTSSCVLPSPLVLLPRQLTECRPKYNERAQRVFSTSLTWIRADDHCRITPTVYSLRHADAHPWPHFALSRTKLIWSVVNCFNKLYR